MINSSKLSILGIIAALILLSDAWAATGNVTITSPDPNQAYETSANFSVGGAYRMDSSDPGGAIWVPAGDSALPQCTYGGWLYPGGYYNGDWGEGTKGVVYYTVDGVYKGQIGSIWWNVWGYNNIGVNNQFSAGVDIRGLDPQIEHTAVINLQNVYGGQCYNPFCHGYGCGGSWTFFQVNRDIIALKTLNFRIVPPCDLKIDGFTRSRDIIDPSIGESVIFSGAMTEMSGQNVLWTVTINDAVGSTRKVFSGSGKTVSANWDGKDIHGIVEDGIYTAVLTAETSDGKCKKTATAQVEVKSSCRVSMYVTPSEVLPDVGNQYNFGPGSTESNVVVTLESPAPPSGCTIELSVEPVKSSGGHMEDGHKGTRPKGNVAPVTISFSKGDEGSKKATYTSSVVSGKETVKAKLKENGNTIGESTITIRVPALTPLGADRII